MHTLIDFNLLNISIGSVLLVLSIVMFMIPIRHARRWHKFRTGRNTLAIAYIALGLLMITDGMLGDGSRNLSGMITLIVAILQALMYTKTCVLFLKPCSFDDKEYRILLTAHAVFSIMLVLSYILNQTIFTWMFYIGTGLYALLLGYCTSVFSKNYKETLKHLEYIYDEDMYYCLRWVKGCFYSALAVGIMALFMTIFYKIIIINSIGIILYTIYYLCMVGYFMRYVSNYGFMLKSDEGGQDKETKVKTMTAREKKQIADRLEKWIERKKYRTCNKKVEDIVEELGTTRSNLNEYMNTRYNMNFRTWRNHLRIEDAKLLLTDTDIPLADIFIVVGFSDRSNFHRYFTDIVGMTPAQYRNRYK